MVVARKKMTIGEALRDVRLAQGLSQEDIAHACDVTQGAVSNWELGKNAITLDETLSYAKACKVSLLVVLIAAGYVAQPLTVEDAIGDDVRMTPAQKEMLLGAYRAAVDT